jgi:hypothetical protein
MRMYRPHRAMALAVGSCICAAAIGAHAQPVPVTMPGAAVVVPPTIIDGPRPPVIALPAPPMEVKRPAPLTTCDSAGCWDADGRRLNNVGPLLMGPHGPCIRQGGVVQCP